MVCIIYLLDSTGRGAKIYIEVWRTLARRQTKVDSASLNSISSNYRLTCGQTTVVTILQKITLLSRILLSTTAETCTAQTPIPPTGSKENIQGLKGMQQQMLTSFFHGSVKQGILLLPGKTRHPSPWKASPPLPVPTQTSKLMKGE